MATRFGIQFEGFDSLMERYKQLGGDLNAIAEECLIAAHSEVTPKLHADISRHRRTGKTEDSIVDTQTVKWEGSVATIDVGFNLRDHGMPSIFLMYGTPRMRKDSKLYNDIYGRAVQTRIAEKQRDILQRAIRMRLGD